MVTILLLYKPNAVAAYERDRVFMRPHEYFSPAGLGAWRMWYQNFAFYDRLRQEQHVKRRYDLRDIRSGARYLAVWDNNTMNERLREAKR